MILSAPLVLPCYDLRNLVLHDKGTFKDHDLSPSTPILRVGGGGLRTPEYVKNNFRLLLTTFSKARSTTIESCESY